MLTVSPDLLTAAAAGRTVLTPNTELANALFDAIERAHRDAGDRIWPTPRVRDWSSWLRERHEQRQLADSTVPRLLNEVEEREIWRMVIDAAQAGPDYLDPGGAARAAQRARRTMREYAIPWSALDDQESEEVRAFLGWNQAFEQRCRALGCVGADSLQNGLGPPLHAVSWLESAQWRPSARHWLERFGEMLRPEDGASAPVAIVAAPSPAAELSGMADWARAGLADEHFRAWICVPDLTTRRAEVVDAFDAALAPQRFGLRGGSAAAPYAVAGGTPLADHASVRAALELLAASVDVVPFSRFSVLLRAPELQASEADSSSAARLDVALRRRAPNEADLPGWLDTAEWVARAENMPPPAALQRLRAAQQVLLELGGAHHFSEWVAVWIAALEAAPWALRGRWTSIEYQAAERFRELLATLATGDSVLGTHSRDSAQRILRRAARETAFQVQTGVPPVWISGQLLDPWLNYDGIWVASCDDEQWPPPVAPLALLPIRLQRQYGVISASPASQLAAAVELQSRWLKRAGRCVFSHADVAEGSLSSPSPLLPQNVSRLSPPPVPVAPPHWCALFETAPLLQSLWDEFAPPHGGSERNHGVATLRAQSRCAFRGFAETRLAVQRLEQPVPGFSDRERGELVHHALEHVWSTLRDSSALHALIPEAQGQLLDAAANHALEIVCRRRDPGRLWQRRERVRLKNLLGNWLQVERARAPFSVEALEQSGQIAQFAGLEFRVRIDRVDRLTDGGRVLIDYKTGAAGADWRGDRPDNPQLPVYALLRREALVAVAYAKVNAAERGFVVESERRDIFPRTRATKLEGMTSFSELVEVWSQRMTRIAGEFAAGRAEVAPTLKACLSCDLHGLCRVPAALEEADELHE